VKAENNNRDDNGTKVEIGEKHNWFAMTTYGFYNAPISWKRSQHSSITGDFGGENLCTVMKFPASSSKSIEDDDDDDEEDVSMASVDETVASHTTTIMQKEPKGGKYIMWEVIGERDEHS